MWKYLCLLPIIYCQALLHTLSVPALFGKPSHMYPLPTVDDVSVLVTIKGKHEARIWLCPDEYPTQQQLHFSTEKHKSKYLSKIQRKTHQSSRNHIKHRNKMTPCDAGMEVLFGSTSNQYVTIRDHWYITETSTFIAPLYHGNVLDEDEYRPFWINWKNNELTVGFGLSIYKQLILSYREDALTSSSSWRMTPSHSYQLRNIAFSSWEEPIDFIFYLQHAIPQPFPTFSTSSEYEQFGQNKQMMRLSTNGFRVILECQGLSECNIALLRSYQWRTEDAKAIEIVLHDAFERRHLYSRNLIRYGTGLGGKILAESNHTVLSSSEFRPFWIEWTLTDAEQKRGTLSIGQGIDVGKQKFLATSTSFSTPFVYMGCSNYFLATSVRILYASSMNQILYNFDKSIYRVIKTIEASTTIEPPLTFSYGRNSVNRGFRVGTVPQECPRLTQCNPPDSSLHPFHVSHPVQPRIQWWHHGAYCAEVSIQTVLLGKGVYMSQAWIRKHSPYSGSPAFFGDTTYGYEIVPGNIIQALDQLDISYEQWKGTDSTLFFQWLKRHLVQGTPVVWFIQSATSTYVEHAEPVVGYHSMYPLHHTRVYPTDMIRYHNNIELLSYYRRVDSFVDKGTQQNCTRGISFGTECVSPQFQFAVAIHGMKTKSIENNSLSSVSLSPVVVSITVSDGGMESLQVKWIYATVTLSDLTIGKKYAIVRNDSSKHNNIRHFFKAKQSSMVWKDDTRIRSDSYVYYRVTIIE